MGGLFRNKGRLDALMWTKITLILSLCPQIYFRLQACAAARSALSCVCLVLLLCCQHKGRHLREKSVQKGKKKSDETKAWKTAGNGVMMKSRDKKEGGYEMKDRNWKRETRTTFDHIRHQP